MSDKQTLEAPNMTIQKQASSGHLLSSNKHPLYMNLTHNLLCLLSTFSFVSFVQKKIIFSMRYVCFLRKYTSNSSSSLLLFGYNQLVIAAKFYVSSFLCLSPSPLLFQSWITPTDAVSSSNDIFNVTLFSLMSLSYKKSPKIAGPSIHLHSAGIADANEEAVSWL